MVVETRNKRGRTREGSGSGSSSSSSSPPFEPQPTSQPARSAPRKASSTQVSSTSAQEPPPSQDPSTKDPPKKVVSKKRVRDNDPPVLKSSKRVPNPIITNMPLNLNSSLSTPALIKRRRRYKLAPVPATPKTRPYFIPGPELAPEGYPFTFGPPSPKYKRGGDETVEKLHTPENYHLEFERKV